MRSRRSRPRPASANGIADIGLRNLDGDRLENAFVPANVASKNGQDAGKQGAAQARTCAVDEAGRLRRGFAHVEGERIALFDGRHLDLIEPVGVAVMVEKIACTINSVGDEL